jgi:F0F1-type ATP synthase assembly protein I
VTLGQRRSWARGFGSFLTMGLQLALTVVIFFFLGRWLDEKFDTRPWLMMAGLVIGTVGGFINFIRTAASMGKQADHEAEERAKDMHGED